MNIIRRLGSWGLTTLLVLKWRLGLRLCGVTFVVVLLKMGAPGKLLAYNPCNAHKTCEVCVGQPQEPKGYYMTPLMHRGRIWTTYYGCKWKRTRRFGHRCTKVLAPRATQAGDFIYVAVNPFDWVGPGQVSQCSQPPIAESDGDAVTTSEELNNGYQVVIDCLQEGQREIAGGQDVETTVNRVEKCMEES